MFVTPEIFDNFPADIPDNRERFGRLRADFDTFITGGLITVSEDPLQAGSAFLARLDPIEDEIWDLRSRSRPGIRVFGCFSETDTFIALHLDFRKNLGNRTSKNGATQLEELRPSEKKNADLQAAIQTNIQRVYI